MRDIEGLAFTINRYSYRRWGWFRGVQRCGLNFGYLAFRLSYRKRGQSI